MQDFTVSNDPNPARLIESLRHVGYGNYEAIADLVDNCFDADAHRITIRVQQRSGDWVITIADNGSGMDHDTLDQALRLGSLTERDVATDLGKFGMGMVTASLSLSRNTFVITKQDGNYLTSIVDVDEIIKANNFCKVLRPSTDDERGAFDELLGTTSTGTMLTLSKTDGIKNRNVTQFSNQLRKHLGEVHRLFLTSGADGRTITINDRLAEPIDPLMWDHPDTERVSDEMYPIELEDNGSVSTENIRVRIALIPEDASAGELSFTKGLQHQGFYLMRNNRQVFHAATLGYFSKHNDFNRMRGEIYFSGKFDKSVGIEFTKRQVTFTQQIQDRLGDLHAQCTTIKRRMAGRAVTRASADQNKYHEQASRTITEKSRLLITPKAIIEKRRPRKVRNGKTRSIHQPTTQTRENFKDEQEVSSSLRCKFLHQKLGPNGQIFECDMVGRTVLIRWNIEHPFFRRFVVDNQDDGRLVTAVDFLVYSMACAELRARDEENVEFINTMKAIISANLRTLLN